MVSAACTHVRTASQQLQRLKLGDQGLQFTAAGKAQQPTLLPLRSSKSPVVEAS